MLISFLVNWRKKGSGLETKLLQLFFQPLSEVETAWRRDVVRAYWIHNISDIRFGRVLWPCHLNQKNGTVNTHHAHFRTQNMERFLPTVRAPKAHLLALYGCRINWYWLGVVAQKVVPDFFFVSSLQLKTFPANEPERGVFTAIFLFFPWSLN